MTGSRPAYRAFLSRHFLPGRIYTLVGAGGKSTGMRKIADSLAGRGIRARLTTTMKIGIEEFAAYPVTIVRDATELALSLGGGAPVMVIVGDVLREKGRYTGIAASLIERVTIPTDVVLLVEGDGSRRKPIEALPHYKVTADKVLEYQLKRYGCGGLCGYAIECFEKGLITSKQTGGLKLAWGDAASVIALVEMIGKAEGIGAVLAKGFEEAVRVFGKATAPYVMAVRNEGLAAHDPHWHASLALTYYYDPTPARHTQGSLAFPLAGYTVEGVTAHQSTGLARQHHENANLSHALNAAGLCLFGYAMLDYKSLPDFLAAADGTAWSIEELAKAGLSIATARFLFNSRAGIVPGRDRFPQRELGAASRGRRYQRRAGGPKHHNAGVPGAAGCGSQDWVAVQERAGRTGAG